MATIDTAALKPVHLPDRQRFEIDLGDSVAEIDYRISGDTMVMHHTGVPAAHGGQGIAAIITQYALDWAKEHGYKVDPQCSYIRTYIERHPEYQANAEGF